MHRFEQLQVWQRAQRFTLDCDAIASQLRCEYASQLRRSAASIADNIAEGCGRVTDRELGHFVAIAMGSCAEAQAQLRRAVVMTDADGFRDLLREAQEIGWMLAALRRRMIPAAGGGG